jgi:hypothetical protein
MKLSIHRSVSKEVILACCCIIEVCAPSVHTLLLRILHCVTKFIPLKTSFECESNGTQIYVLLTKFIFS